MPSRPFSANTISSPRDSSALTRARTGCARRRRPAAPSCRRRRPRRGWPPRACAAARPASTTAARCRNSAVSSSSRSGERTSLTTIVFGVLAQPRLLAAREVLARVDDHRDVREALVGADLLEQLEAAHLRQLEVEHDAVDARLLLERLERLLAGGRRGDLDVVAVADQLADRVALDRRCRRPPARACTRCSMRSLMSSSASVERGVADRHLQVAGGAGLQRVLAQLGRRRPCRPGCGASRQLLQLLERLQVGVQHDRVRAPVAGHRDAGVAGGTRRGP